MTVVMNDPNRHFVSDHYDSNGNCPTDTSCFGVWLPAALDLNGDGRMDLLVSDTGGLTELLGNGDGTFTDGPTALATVVGENNGFTLGDFNEDGMLDAVTSVGPNAGFPFLEFYAGQAGGTFAQGTNVVSLPNCYPGSVVGADFDGDGHLDVLRSQRLESARDSSHPRR